MQPSLRALTYYRADLDPIPPLTREEEMLLVERLRLARDHALPASLVAQARRRLVEGNQYLVLFLALKSYRSFERLDLEDLIQEGSLALLEATGRCSFQGETFSGYASLAIRRGFAKARCHDWPLFLSQGVLSALYKRGEVHDNATLHAASLDRPVEGSDDEDKTPLAETIAAPTLLLAPVLDDEEKTELVESLLAGLTERQRQVLCLRYGLDPVDRRERTNVEIAQLLHLPETTVSQTLKRALAACRRLYMQRLRQQAEGKAQHPLTPQRSQQAHDGRKARRRLEQYHKLQEAEATLQAQGQHVTAKRLAPLAHVDEHVAREYVRTQRDQAHEQAYQCAEQARLEEAYATLQAQGSPITLHRLCQIATVGIKTASMFMHEKAGDDEARLRAAYAQLQTQGLKKLGRRRLAQAAGVSENRAAIFLREQQAAMADI